MRATYLAHVLYERGMAQIEIVMISKRDTWKIRELTFDW